MFEGVIMCVELIFSKQANYNKMRKFIAAILTTRINLLFLIYMKKLAMILGILNVNWLKGYILKGLCRKAKQ